MLGILVGWEATVWGSINKLERPRYRAFYIVGHYIFDRGMEKGEIMKNRLFTILLLISSIATARAAIICGDFNDGIDELLWETYSFGASDAPWNILVPPPGGKLRVSKGSDTDSLTALNELDAGIRSKFTVEGDFSISVNFELLDFPLSNSGGWNEIFLRVASEESGSFFETIRGASDTGHFVEAYTNVGGQIIGLTGTTSSNGVLGVDRTGQQMTAWVDFGEGRETLGDLFSEQFEGAMLIELFAAQVPDGISGFPRSSTALDVRFDNLCIIPEPASVILFGLGGLVLARKRK